MATSDAPRDTPPTAEGQRPEAESFGAADLTLGRDTEHQHEPELTPGDSDRTSRGGRRRRGWGPAMFLLGVAVGVSAAILVPRYAQPYVDTVGSRLSSDTRPAGTVIDKRLEGNRLLLRVLTDEGITLATFTQNLDDIDLLIAQGDVVEFGGGRYAPFLHDPTILRVRPTGTGSEGALPPATDPAGPQSFQSPAPPADGRAQYERRMEAELRGLEALITALERRLARAGTTINEEASQYLDDLGERRATARARLDEIRAASGDAWLDLRVGLEAAWQDLREALIAAQRHFVEDESANPPPTVPNR